MSTVTIFRFTMYDIEHDEKRRSRRWGTRPAIEGLGGEIIESTATEVDPSVLDSDYPGLTVRDFQPNRQTGFQKQVMP